jgi:hypothetical protein
MDDLEQFLEHPHILSMVLRPSPPNLPMICHGNRMSLVFSFVQILSTSNMFVVIEFHSIPNHGKPIYCKWQVHASPMDEN